MVNRLISVGDTLTIPANVKVPDASLPTRLGDTALNTKVSTGISDAVGVTVAAASVAGRADAAISLATSGKPSPVAIISKMVSNLQTGHGWTVLGTPSASNLNDTADFCLGTQSASVTTTGTGGQGAGFDKTGLVINAVGNNIALWIKIDDYSKLGSAILYLGNFDLSSNYNGQILNGASFRESQSVARSGEWVKYIFPFSDLTTIQGTPDRANLTRARLMVFDRQTGPLKFNFNGLALTDESTTFPQGVVSITMDDNGATQYTAGRPKMDQYGFSATMYPIVSQVSQPGTLTLSQMRALQDVNGWDFGAHASNMTVHAASLASYAEAQLVEEFEAIRAWMRDNGFRGESYAWPQTDSSTDAERIASRYFRSGRGGYYRTHETLPPNNPFRLRSTPIHGLTLTQMKAEVDLAKTGKAWVIFTVHNIVDTKSTSVDTLRSDFDALIDYIAAQGVAVRTVSQVLDAVS